MFPLFMSDPASNGSAMVQETEEDRLRKALRAQGLGDMAIDGYLRGGAPGSSGIVAKEQDIRNWYKQGGVGDMALDPFMKAGAPGTPMPLPAIDSYAPPTDLMFRKERDSNLGGIPSRASILTSPTAPVSGVSEMYSAIPSVISRTPSPYSRTLDDVTINDGFDAAGNLIGAEPTPNGLPRSPFIPIDNYMQKEPVHILGANGFRSGWSAPSVIQPTEYMNALDHNRRVARESDLKDLQLQSLALDKYRIDRAEQAYNAKDSQYDKALDSALRIAGDPRIETSIAIARLKGLDIPEKEKNAAILGRTQSFSPDGKSFTQVKPINSDKKVDLSEIVKRVPSDIPQDQVMEWLAVNRGVDRNMITSRLAELYEAGTPWWSRSWDLGKQTSRFDPQNLSDKDRSEYEGIIKLFGKKNAQLAPIMSR